MKVSIKKIEIKYKQTSAEGFLFLPKELTEQQLIAVFTHGYTAHKGTLLNWAQRLSIFNIPTLIFDLPGHFQGNFRDINNFEDFKEDSPNLFNQAFNEIIKNYPIINNPHYIVGGHSLGGLLALMAGPTLPKKLKKDFIIVGLGQHPNYKQHLFETPLYENTLNMMKYLVSDCLCPEVLIPWVKDEKDNLEISKQKIHLISGEDDFAVTHEGAKWMEKILKNKNNQVSLKIPKHLPHHMPELAAPHIYQYIKKNILNKNLQ